VNDTLKEIADDDREWAFAESLGVDMSQYNGPWDSVYCPRREEELDEEILFDEQADETPIEEQADEIPIDEP
jgi:Zn/Cd-binding protein ZinT